MFWVELQEKKLEKPKEVTLGLRVFGDGLRARKTFVNTLVSEIIESLVLGKRLIAIRVCYL